MTLFDELFDGEQENAVGDITIIPVEENRELLGQFKKLEVEGALKIMKLKKVVGQMVTY